MRSPVSIPPRPDDLGLTLRSWAAGAFPSRPSPRRAAAAAILAAGTLALATALAIALESGGIGIEDASPVYLIAVVAVGSQFGTWAAIATAVIAFLVYDFLLTEPRLSLVVDDPREWLDLLLFLFVAIAIGRLVAIQHGRAEESAARAREASSLFAMSRLLATADSADQAAPELARRLAVDAGLRRVWIAVGDHGRQAIVADTGLDAPIPASAVLTTLVRTPGDEPARWVRTHEAGRSREPLGGGLQVLKVRIETSSGDGTVDAAGVLGSIGAIRDRSNGLPTRAETRILALAADQIALSLRRDQLRREATDVEVARQGDALKTALIDSVSHDLRTPLASIRATAGGLMDPAVPVTEGSRGPPRWSSMRKPRDSTTSFAPSSTSAGSRPARSARNSSRTTWETWSMRSWRVCARPPGAHDRGLPAGRACRPCSSTRAHDVVLANLARQRPHPLESAGRGSDLGPCRPRMVGSSSTSRTAGRAFPARPCRTCSTGSTACPGSGSRCAKGAGHRTQHRARPGRGDGRQRPCRRKPLGGLAVSVSLAVADDPGDGSDR